MKGNDFMNKFTKKDLKPWMIVKTRDGWLYMVHELENELLLADASECLALTNYEEDLLFYDKESKVLDIIDVRKPNEIYQFINENWRDAPIIWKRKELPNQDEKGE